MSEDPLRWLIAIPMFLWLLFVLFGHPWTNGGKGSRGHGAGLIIKWFVLGTIGLAVLSSCS